MIRRSRFRSLLAMLLAFSLLSASLWSYSAEAVTDALAEELSMIASAGDTGEHHTGDRICNHGCHAQTHLIGLDSCVSTLVVANVSEHHDIQTSTVFPTQAREGRFAHRVLPFKPEPIRFVNAHPWVLRFVIA